MHEHRGVDGRPGPGEVQIRVGQGEQGRARRVGQLAEPFDGDGRHDRVLALEVAVENRLAVLDPFGEAARGHRAPALHLGELAGRGDDQPVPFRSFALAALLCGHRQILALLDIGATLGLASI
jgi:hypothetical protein